MGEIERRFIAEFNDAMSQTLMSSVPYAFLRVAEVCNSLMLNAFLVFLPKIIENFYNVTPSVAGTVVGKWKYFSGRIDSHLSAGAVFVPCCFAGTLIGGVVVQRYQLDMRHCFLFLMLTNIVVFGGTFVFLTYCDVQPFFGAGVNRFEAIIRWLRRELPFAAQKSTSISRAMSNAARVSTATNQSATRARALPFIRHAMPAARHKRVSQVLAAATSKDGCTARVPPRKTPRSSTVSAASRVSARSCTFS